MTRAVVAAFVYLGVVVSPLVFAVIGASEPDHDFWTNFSVALGFTGLMMMGLEFALVARFRAVATPFGQDSLLQFHRQIGYVGLVFILTHFAVSAHWRDVTPAKALADPLRVWFGMAAMLSLIVLIATSVWGRRLRLSYEVWHAIHAVLAVVLVVGAVGAHHLRRRVRELAVEADPVGADVGGVRWPVDLGPAGEAAARAPVDGERRDGPPR